MIFFISIFLWLISAPLFAASVVMDADILVDYERFKSGRNVIEIDHYGGAHARRDVIEVVLLHQALYLGGYRDVLELAPEDSYRRLLQKVSSGQVTVSGVPVWDEDTHSVSLYRTEAIIREGEFVVGLYTSPYNEKALAVTKASDLHALTIVSTPQWRSDWRTVQSMDFSQIYDTFLWPMMVKMVWSKRADVTLAPFQPNDSMAAYSEGLSLVPIPNIKVSLRGSRHWVVSRVDPEGARLFAALEKGVSILRQQGRINRAYIESGFFDPRVKDWKVINATLPIQNHKRKLRSGTFRGPVQ